MKFDALVNRHICHEEDALYCQMLRYYLTWNDLLGTMNCLPYVFLGLRKDLNWLLWYLDCDSERKSFGDVLCKLVLRFLLIYWWQILFDAGDEVVEMSRDLFKLKYFGDLSVCWWVGLNLCCWMGFDWCYIESCQYKMVNSDAKLNWHWWDGFYWKDLWLNGWDRDDESHRSCGEGWWLVQMIVVWFVPWWTSTLPKADSFPFWSWWDRRCCWSSRSHSLFHPGIAMRLELALVDSKSS